MAKMRGAIAPSDYQRLAEFRAEIRRFLRFGEQAAREVGLEPQQHQLLLTAKGMPDGRPATIGDLAERLQLLHHSVVELVGRLVDRGLVERERGAADRRQVFVRLTWQGEAVLRDLAVHHMAELRMAAPALIRTLSALVATGDAAASATMSEETAG